jgi:hypothetical protein
MNVFVKAFILFWLIVIIYTISIFGYIYINSRNISYDSAKWTTGDEIVKGRMVNDIVENELFTGKHKDQVIAALDIPNISYPDIFIYHIYMRQCDAYRRFLIFNTTITTKIITGARTKDEAAGCD